VVGRPLDRIDAFTAIKFQRETEEERLGERLMRLVRHRLTTPKLLAILIRVGIVRRVCGDGCSKLANRFQ